MNESSLEIQYMLSCKKHIGRDSPTSPRASLFSDVHIIQEPSACSVPHASNAMLRFVG